MKLEGSLFFIEQMPDQVRHDGAVIAGSDRQSLYRIRLNPEHTIYKAHFPELPITPGVILVRIGVELLGLMLGRKVRMVGAPNIKFTAPVYPEDGKELEYEINVKVPPQSVIAGGDRQSLATIIVKDEETVYSKQSLRYE